MQKLGGCGHRARIEAVKKRGGLIFYYALSRTLRVNEIVSARIERNRCNKNPVACTMDGQSGPKHWPSSMNKQETVNNCVGKKTTLVTDGTIKQCRPIASETVEAPLKFFCLPCFARQQARGSSPSLSLVEDVR